jgi:hypothetical protein
MKAVAMMTPLPKNLAMTKTRLGIFKAGTRFDKTGKNAPAIHVNIHTPRHKGGRKIPKLLVARTMNNAPICNPRLNCADGSRPPPPHVGFAVVTGDVGDALDEALAATCRATCRATSCIISDAGIVVFRGRWM